MDDPWADTAPPKKDATSAVDRVECSPALTDNEASADTDAPFVVEQNDVAPDAAASLSTSKSEEADFEEDQEPASGVGLQDTNPEGAEDDGFDDFDDFDEPTAGPSVVAGGQGAVVDSAGDDGFGDFGDFEEGDLEADEVAENAPAAPPAPAASTAPQWQSLRLRPLPSRSEIVAQLSELLEPMIASSSGSSSNLTDEPVRAVGGLRQVMVTPGSQDAYVQLNTPPQLKPLDWTRSRVRREHLISMGVPVNLDEVDSHRLTALPPLRITTSSMPPPQVPHRRTPSRSFEDPRVSADGKGKVRDSGSGGFDGRNGSTGPVGLGDRPELDTQKAEDLCGLEEDKLSLSPLAQLKRMQDELASTSAQASALLAWLLQLKDARTQDSATYNGMISELIANAAKAKSAQTASSGGVFRRSSQRQRQQSVLGGGGGGSAGTTPRSATPSHLR